MLIAIDLKKQQEMLHTLTIRIREIIDACIHNLRKLPNIHFQQDYLPEKQ